MYLEYIPDVSVYSPLLILSPAIPEEVEKLSQALTNLVADNNAVIDVHALPFISPVDGCRLSAQVIDEDIGAVSNRENKKSFQMAVDMSRVGMGIKVINSLHRSRSRSSSMART